VSNNIELQNGFKDTISFNDGINVHHFTPTCCYKLFKDWKDYYHYINLYFTF